MLATLVVSALVCSSSAAGDPPKKKRPSVEEVFKKLDKDGDGKVTRDEFQAHPGIKNKEAAAKAFKAADADADGSLTLDEFRDWAERMTERRREKKSDDPRSIKGVTPAACPVVLRSLECRSMDRHSRSAT